MPGDVAMKCTFRHLSHMMPIWIGMGEDYGTTACPEAYARSCEETDHPDEWIAVTIGGGVLLIAFLFWFFLRRV
jgi:hypothetical protein